MDSASLQSHSAGGSTLFDARWGMEEGEGAAIADAGGALPLSLGNPCAGAACRTAARNP